MLQKTSSWRFKLLLVRIIAVCSKFSHRKHLLVDAFPHNNFNYLGRVKDTYVTTQCLLTPQYHPSPKSKHTSITFRPVTPSSSSSTRRTPLTPAEKSELHFLCGWSFMKNGSNHKAVEEFMKALKHSLNHERVRRSRLLSTGVQNLDATTVCRW